MALDSNFQYIDDGLTEIPDEPVTVNASDVAYYLKHDNASNILIYTQLNKTGVQVADFTVTNDVTKNWKQKINFGATARSNYATQVLYITYDSTGDQADSELFQELRDAIIALETTVAGISSGQDTLIASTIPTDDSTDISRTSTVVINMNKWIDDGQENKLKVYSDSGRITEVSGTVAKTGNKQLTWTESSPMDYSTMYYPRVLSGLLGVDGVSLTSNYDFNFQIANAPPNTAPSFTSVTVSGTTNLGDTLTMALNGYADDDGDLAGTHTKRWLRNDVAITSATNTTYAIVEADLGRTINAEGTPVALTGTSPGTPVLSTDLVIPIPAPPSISVSAGNAQTTTTWTANSTLSTEAYNLYWSTTTGVTKSNGTKIPSVTSPYVHTGRTNGTAYYYVLVMEVNGVESTESTQQSGTPSANASPTISSLAVQNTLTATSIDIQGIIADADNTVPTDITEVTIELSTNDFSTIAYTKVLTVSGDIAAFDGSADWYTWTATFTGGTYKARAKAKDSGSGVYGAWSTATNAFEIGRSVAYSVQPVIGYFYDDGTNTHPRGVFPFWNKQDGSVYSYFGAGVTSVSTTHYVYGNITGTPIATSIARTNGWHKVEGRPSTGQILLDDVVVATDTTNLARISMIALFTNGLYTTYFDDVSCEDFTDGFEGTTMDKRYLPSIAVGSTYDYSPSVTQKRTGSKGLKVSASATSSSFHGAKYSFKTIGQPVAVSSTSPVNSATGVLTSAIIEATFNEAMDYTTAAANFKVYSDAGRTAEVAGTLSQIAENVWRFTPSVAFTNAAIYYPCIKTGATSIVGLTLQAQYNWSFTVAA